MEVLVLSMPFIILYTFSLIILTQFVRPCSRDYIQICENCKAASHCGGAKEATGITDMYECKERCKLNTTCSLAEYITNASKCVMYSCSEVEIDASSAVIRKTCTSDCERFTVKKKLKRLGTCKFLLHGCILTETACASLCYDLSGCRSFSHDASTPTCHLHTCKHSTIREVEGWNHTVRECLPDTHEIYLATSQVTTPPSSSIDALTCQQSISDTIMPLIETSSEQTASATEGEATYFPFSSSEFKIKATRTQLIPGTTALHFSAIKSTTLRQTLLPTLLSSRKPSTTVLDNERKSLINESSNVTLSAGQHSTTETSSSSPESLNSNSKKPIPYNIKAKLKCLSCKMRSSILLVILLLSVYSSQKL